MTQLSLLGCFRWSLAPCLRRGDSCPLILALYITYTCCSAVDNITGSSASREQRGECFGKYVCPGGNLHLCNTALANYLPQAELAKPGPCYEERRGEQGEQINVVLVVVVVGPSFLPSFVFVCSPDRDLGDHGDHGGLSVPCSLALFYPKQSPKLMSATASPRPTSAVQGHLGG